MHLAERTMRQFAGHNRVLISWLIIYDRREMRKSNHQKKKTHRLGCTGYRILSCTIKIYKFMHWPGRFCGSAYVQMVVRLPNINLVWRRWRQQQPAPVWLCCRGTHNGYSSAKIIISLREFRGPPSVWRTTRIVLSDAWCMCVFAWPSQSRASSNLKFQLNQFLIGYRFSKKTHKIKKRTSSPCRRQPQQQQQQHFAREFWSSHGPRIGLKSVSHSLWCFYLFFVLLVLLVSTAIYLMMAMMTMT